jgi:hypothetical protein
MHNEITVQYKTKCTDQNYRKEISSLGPHLVECHQFIILTPSYSCYGNRKALLIFFFIFLNVSPDTRMQKPNYIEYKPTTAAPS